MRTEPRMRRSVAGACLLAAFAASVMTATQAPSSPPLVGEAAPPASALSLWYRAPASDHPLLPLDASRQSRQAGTVEWVRALPVGNGRIGAMVFGGIVHERLQLNEDTLWAGRPYDPVNPQAKEALPEVRRLLAAGDYPAAAKLVGTNVMAKPLAQMPYQTVGDLALTFPQVDAVENYRRDLDLTTATAHVSFTSDGVTFSREVFASAPDQVIVVRLTASRPGRISFEARMQTPQRATVEASRTQAAGPKIRWRAGGLALDNDAPGNAQHPSPARFLMTVRAPEHPIMKGLPPAWMHANDELYSYLRGPARNVTILATATAPTSMPNGTGENEAIVMAIAYGQGRIFHDTLGHVGATQKEPIAPMNSVDYIVLLHAAPNGRDRRVDDPGAARLPGRRQDVDQVRSSAVIEIPARWLKAGFLSTRPTSSTGCTARVRAGSRAPAPRRPSARHQRFETIQRSVRIPDGSASPVRLWGWRASGDRGESPAQAATDRPSPWLAGGRRT